MNKIIVAGVAAAGIALAGCSPTAVGTGTGAAIGGILTAALSGNVQQIAIGTLIGGAGGFVVSSVTQAANQPRGVCQAVNQYGQPIYVLPNGQPTTTPTATPLLMQC